MHRIVVVALVVLCALSACGRPEASAPAAAAPTKTARPTWTPLPATATPLPPTPTLRPTATAIPPTPTLLPVQSGDEIAATLQAALDQTAGLSVFQLEYVMSSKAYESRRRAEVEAPGGKVMARLDIDQTVPVVRISGTYNGDSTHTVTTYYCGCEDDEGRKVEVVEVDGSVYTRSLDDDTWYVLSPEEAEDLDLAFESQRIFSLLLNRHVDLAQLQAGRSDTIEGHACTVYEGDAQVAARAVFGMGAGEDATALDAALEEIYTNDGGLEVWACDDGLLRQIHVDFSGYSKESPDTPFAIAIDTFLHHIDEPIAIYAPADALPFDSAPTFGDELIATVFNGGNIREQPSMQGAVLGQLHAGQLVYLYEQSADGTWYLVDAPEGYGWVHASLLTIDPLIKAQVPVSGESVDAPPVSDAAPAGPSATVFNGGNVRAAPNAQGQVLDQINAREAVRLLAKTADGVWYKITNARNVTGWVHGSLLTVDPSVVAQVPVE